VEEALQDYAELPLRRHSHRVLLPPAYLALAEVLNAPLITRDRAFASIKGRRAKIVVF
jgi:predicted nucleic acid-binding protein